jgi:alginate biosynthesis protein AlgX
VWVKRVNHSGVTVKRSTVLGLFTLGSIAVTSLCTLQAAPGQIPVCVKAQQKDLPSNAGFGFLTPGLNGTLMYYADLSPNFFALEGRTQYYAQLDQALKNKGIQLVVSPLPTRTIVYPEMIDQTQATQKNYRPDVARENYRASLRRLWGLNVYTIDLLGAALNHRQSGAKQNLYFARDYHWTSDGTRVYAKAIAQEISKLDSYKSLKQEKFVNTFLRNENAESRLGFLLEQVCGTKTPPEKMGIYETSRTGGALLGDDAYPVVLVGSSYSAEPKYNFEGFLKEALSLNLLNAAISGGGYNASLEAYFLSPAYAKSKPKFIIWEFSASTTPYDQTPLREIIPSVYGDCSAGNALLSAKSTMRAGTTSVLQNSSKEIRGAQGFVSLKFADKTLLKFDLSLKFDDGKQETVQIARSERIPNEGQFFLKFSDEFAGNLKEVTVKTAQKVTGTVSAKICKI